MFASIAAAKSATSSTVDVDATIAESVAACPMATATYSAKRTAAVSALVALFGLPSPATTTAPRDKGRALTGLSFDDSSHAEVATPDRNRTTTLRKALSTWDCQQRRIDGKLDQPKWKRRQQFLYANPARSTSIPRAMMRSIFAGIIMFSAPTPVAHAAEAQYDAPLQPGYGYMQAPVGHEQQTQDDVNGADHIQFDENALAKKIEQENERLDRELRGICSGC